VCGGNPVEYMTCNAVPGLSPRVRGKRILLRQESPTIRPIPACAGETLFEFLLRFFPRAYPRVCGGNRDNSL